jgi:hypothetical protein
LVGSGIIVVCLILRRRLSGHGTIR